MGRNRIRWTFDIDIRTAKFRTVRIFNDMMTFNALVMAPTDQEALRIAEKEEPGFQYEILPTTYFRMFIDEKHIIN